MQRDDTKRHSAVFHNRSTTFAGSGIEENAGSTDNLHSYYSRDRLRPRSMSYKDGERSWLLAPEHRIGYGAGSSAGSGAGSGSCYSADRPKARRNTWMFNGVKQPHSILPTAADDHPRSSPDLAWRSMVKDIPGQTTDPKDPLNRNLSSVRASREDLIRNGSHRSIMTAASATHNNSASISARRNQLQRENSFGVPPNQFLAFIYWLKGLTGRTDTTDEKTTSTVLNVVNVFVDTLFCMLYLVEASTLTRPAGYESHWMYIDRSRSFWHFLVAIAAYNLLTVCCSILFSESKITSLRSVRHIISTLVALPFIFSLFIPNGHQLYVPYFLQSVALVSRVQQALNFYIDIGVSDLPMDPLKSKSITFAMYIITLIYCAISAFQVAEYDQLMGSEDHNDLLKLLYFVLITMSTIGYGDLTPKNQLGYAVVVVIIITVITVFPWMISGIQDAIAQAKAGEGIFKSGGNKFMIISGSLHSAQKLANVLNGFWFTNKEYSNSSFKIVILGLSEPSKDIQALLQSARYKNRVVYLKGTPLEIKDLERIQARYAEGIFIIADRNSPFTPQEEDRHNTLSTLAFRNVSDAGIYTYNLLPETEIYQKMAATQVVCADELRQVLLAFNCLQQATATLILNMLHQRRPSDKITEAWEAEYDDSIGNEFYTSYLNPIFDGKPFGFVSWFLYRRFQVILFGVRIRLQSGEYHTALNPGKDYRFQHNEQCIFIAQNPTDLDDINELSERQLNNFLEHLQQTQQEDEESIGTDYHAKNFATAIQSLSTTRSGGTTRRRAKSKRSTMHIDTYLPYTRRSGRYHLHSAIPTIVCEGDDIDVEPEVCFVSGPEDSDAEQEGNEPSSPRAQQPKMKDSQERVCTLIPDGDLDPGSSSDGAKSILEEPLQGDGLSTVIVGYPPAPFPGAKVPLCMLVDPRFDGDRTLSDMVIKSWAEVLEERRRRRAEGNVERIDQVNSADVLQTPGFEHGEEQDIPVSTSTSSEPANTRSGMHPLRPGTELDHILICSPNYDIFRLICTLRSAHLKQLQDVVILCSREPTNQEFKVLKCFPRLYFLIGDCLLRDDLERGAITKSSKYLFMRHPENAGVDGSFFDSAAVINRILVQQIFSDAQIARAGNRGGMRESDLITLTPGTTASNSVYDPSRQSTLRAMPSKKSISPQSLNEGPQCVYELVEERSVDFLQIRKTDIRIGRDGQCSTGSVRTVLDGIDESLEQFDSQSDSGYYGFPEYASQRKKTNAETGAADFYHNPIYASGGVLVGGLLDHVLYQLYSNPSILQLIKLLCGIRTKADIMRDYHLFKEYGAGCHLECIPVPEGFGVQTMRPTTEAVEEDQADHCSNGSDFSNKNNSDDETEEGDMNKRHNKDRSKSSFSRAASKGKKKISELFNQQNGSVGSSINSDYMYDNRHKNFLHLYEHLALDQGVITIGLLRLQGDDPKTVHLGIGGSSRCYAITNPLLDTVILDTDQVFVLTREKNA